MTHGLNLSTQIYFIVVTHWPRDYHTIFHLCCEFMKTSENKVVIFNDVLPHISEMHIRVMFRKYNPIRRVIVEWAEIGRQEISTPLYLSFSRYFLANVAGWYHALAESGSCVKSRIAGLRASKCLCRKTARAGAVAVNKDKSIARPRAKWENTRRVTRFPSLV